MTGCNLINQFMTLHLILHRTKQLSHHWKSAACFHTCWAHLHELFLSHWTSHLELWRSTPWIHMKSSHWHTFTWPCTLTVIHWSLHHLMSFFFAEHLIAGQLLVLHFLLLISWQPSSLGITPWSFHFPCQFLSHSFAIHLDFSCPHHNCWLTNTTNVIAIHFGNTVTTMNQFCHSSFVLPPHPCPVHSPLHRETVMDSFSETLDTHSCMLPPHR